ncbi:mfs drug transporter [Diplodia corticola]|uniref:Mfs drug transporter n=1 Tax=Diplodia corticola TaxID=236234 RepID=A0A1J9S2K0_9PEZI|nr:mfs drug transporter [Diplodia corticola]OJD33869.1 mfs drug transporter [Diplodia corticola]
MSERNEGPEPVGTPSPAVTVTGEQSDMEKAPVFNEQTKYLPKRRIVSVFLACASIDFAALLDQTSLAASLSIIGRSLNASNQSSWISGAYFVTSTSFQLLYGRLSDIWSRKVILLIGIAIFFFGSLASSLAQDVVQLIVFRAFTGVGGGGLMTVAQFIVSDVVPLRERGKYQGILGAFVALGNGVGPVIGGALASQSEQSWRWIFRLNLPLSVIMVLCVVFFMPLKKVEGDWKLKLKAVDFFGAVLALGGSAVLVLALTWAGGEYAWQSPHVIASFVVGIVVCILFVLWQWKGTSVPLVPLRIFRSRVVAGASITMFINGWNFVTQIYYIPTFYQLVYAHSPTTSGALLLPLTLTQTLCSTLSGLLVTWTGRYREPVLVGWLLWSIGLGLFATLDARSGVGEQVGYAILTGAGVGATLQPSLVAIQAGVPRRDMAVVTAWRNFVRNLGATLGLAVAGTVVNNAVGGAVGGLGLGEEVVRRLLRNPEGVLEGMGDDDAGEVERVRGALEGAYREGFRVVFYVNAGLAAVAFFVAAALLPQVSLVRGDDERLKEEARAKDQERRGGGKGEAEVGARARDGV